MGKVKQLWQEERDKKCLELVTKFMLDGYTREEAEDMAQEDMEAEDAANGQVLVGEGALLVGPELGAPLLPLLGQGRAKCSP